MPVDSRSEETLVVQTVRIRIIFMSMSGVVERASHHTQAPKRTTAATMSPMTRVEPQPHSGASLTATRRATSQPVMSTAPSQLMPRAARTGDSGITTTTATRAARAMAMGIQ